MSLIHELVEMWAQQTPEATAVVFNNKNFSYRELDSHANILAHALIKKSIGPGCLVVSALSPPTK